MKRLILLATGLTGVCRDDGRSGGRRCRGDVGRGLHRGEPVQQPQCAHRVSTARGWKRDAPARLNVGDSNYDSGLAPNVPAGFNVTIPTYIHVITDGSTGRVTNTQIRRQMNVLNLSFAGFYGGANTGISFELAGVTRTDNADWFTMNDRSDERQTKSGASPGRPERAQHLTGTAAGNLGFAYYPSIPAPGRQVRDVDGAVIHYGSLPGGFIGQLQPRLHRDARGRSLVRPRAHVRPGLQRRRRPRRRHAGDARADERLPGGEGHLRRRRGSIRSTTTWTTRTTPVT